MIFMVKEISFLDFLSSIDLILTADLFIEKKIKGRIRIAFPFFSL